MNGRGLTATTASRFRQCLWDPLPTDGGAQKVQMIEVDSDDAGKARGDDLQLNVTIGPTWIKLCMSALMLLGKCSSLFGWTMHLSVKFVVIIACLTRVRALISH